MSNHYGRNDKLWQFSELKLNAVALETHKKPKNHLYSALDITHALDSSPRTPHTPPSSPPRDSLTTNFIDETLDLTSNSAEQNEVPSFASQLEPQMLGPAFVSPRSLQSGFSWHSNSVQSPASEYSDRGIESQSDSNTFSMSPPRLPNLPKTQCVVCKDANMILFNGTELTCGHFAHKTCLKTAVKSLGGVPPSCVACGQDCIAKKATDNVRNESPEPMSSEHSADNELELFGETLIERESPKKDPDTAPIQLRMFVHSQSETHHEVLIKVSTSISAFEHWRYRPTQEDIKAARRFTYAALGATFLSGSRINAANAGCLRLVSVVRNAYTHSKVIAYLFKHAVVLTEKSPDGFEELVHSIDLNRDNVEVRGTAKVLEFIVDGASLVYQASRDTIVNWIAASRDIKLNFPIAQPVALSSPCYIERCLLHLVICLPFEHLTAIPSVLSELGPLDRLGLVVTTRGGLCAWISPHRTCWIGWEVILKEQYYSFEFFTPATQSILETANSLLGPKVTGIQKSVILVAGSPLVTTVIGRPIHVVGIGEYDLDFMSSTAVKSGGQFYHATHTRDLEILLGGIAATERAYTHHDVNLSLVAGPTIQIVDIVGLDRRSIKAMPKSVDISIGSLLAGQSRTVLLVVDGSPLNSQLPILLDCQVRARSAVTDRQQWETQSSFCGNSAEFQVFSERMARIAAAILSEGVDLVETGNIHDLTAMLMRAIAAIKRAVTGFRSNYKLHPQPLIELTDPNLTGTLAAAQAEILAYGLEELQTQLETSAYSNVEAKATLLQASLVLQNQRAVTRRTLLEQVFQEHLETNRI